MDKVKNGNVDVFEEIDRLSRAGRSFLERVLYSQAEVLVSEFNRAVGSEALYLASFVGSWILYGRPTQEDVDKSLLHGRIDVDDLAKLVDRLERCIYDDG